MNKQELEKVFDEKFIIKLETGNKKLACWTSEEKLKDFIFQTVIPEVLKSVLIEKFEETKDIHEVIDFFNDNIKKKSKELYDITL